MRSCPVSDGKPPSFQNPCKSVAGPVTHDGRNFHLDRNRIDPGQYLTHCSTACALHTGSEPPVRPLLRRPRWTWVPELCLPVLDPVHDQDSPPRQRGGPAHGPRSRRGRHRTTPASIRSCPTTCPSPPSCSRAGLRFRYHRAGKVREGACRLIPAGWHPALLRPSARR